MNTPTEKERIEAYKNASSSRQELYGDLEVGETFIHLQQMFSFTEEKRLALIHLFGDTVLGFYSPNDFLLNIQQQLSIPEKDAQIITNKLQVFLNTLTDESPTSTATATQQPIPTQTPLDETKIYEPAPVLRAGYAAGSPEAQKPLTREDILRALNQNTPNTNTPRTPDTR